MSIHPVYAEAIFDGSKAVEFRKRQLAADVTTVLVYATRPTGMIIGTFEITGYDVDSPTAVWKRHHHHGGIRRDAYRDYYRGSREAVAILIEDARRLEVPLLLGEFDPTLRPPQSFQYVDIVPSGAGSAPRPIPVSRWVHDYLSEASAARRG